MSKEIEIVRYKIITKGHIFAIGTIKIPRWGNVLVNDISFFQKGSERWIGFPYKKAEDGSFWPYIKFESKEIKTKFDEAAWEALEIKIKNGNLSEIKEEA